MIKVKFNYNRQTVKARAQFFMSAYKDEMRRKKRNIP